MTTIPPPSPPLAPPRSAGIDAYRGFVMFLMMAEVLRLEQLARAYPGSDVLRFLAWHQHHVEWVGCTLHDLIQPSFSFLVGTSLAFSLAARRDRGQSMTTAFGHALWRGLVLVLLGVFLRSVGRPITYFTFEDTLSQIGLGYPFLFLVALGGARVRVIAFVGILVAFAAAFAAYPAPGADFSWSSVGVEPHLRNQFSGWAAHYEKNANFSWAFDTWFLNLFPREKPFAFNDGGYSTLSFIPTLATMVLGLLAGGILRDPERSPQAKVAAFVGLGLLCLTAGYALGEFGLVPVVKRIWTPSWVLFSGGWCLLLLAAFVTIADIWEVRTPLFPLLVVGANSIAAYMLAELIPGFVAAAIRRHTFAPLAWVNGLVREYVDEGLSVTIPEAWQVTLVGAATLGVLWLMLLWMYRRKVFVRI